MKEQFIHSLTIWICGISFGSLFAQSLRYKAINTIPSSSIKDVYFYLSVLTLPFLLVFAYNAINANGASNWAWSLRLATIGQGKGESKEIYTPLYFVLWNAAYLIELCYFKKERALKTVILGLLCLLFGIITMSKALMLSFFISTSCILYFKKILRTRHFIIGIAVILFAVLYLQGIRQKVQMNEKQTKNTFVIYALSSISAFDTLKPESSKNYGENIFRIYYAVTYKLGISEIKPINTILPWISKPIPTNTYTAMYAPFLDFGVSGIILISLIAGFLYGYIFKSALSGNNIQIIFYAYLTYVIIMQYVGDMLFTNFAGHIKMLLFIIIPFIFKVDKKLV